MNVADGAGGSVTDDEYLARFIARADSFGNARVLKRSVLAFPGGGQDLLAVLRAVKPASVLEIGTYRGVSAALMATFCDRVTTLDLIEGQIEKDGERFDRAAFWRHMCVEDKIELFFVCEDADKRAVLAGRSFDLAFIDGGAVNVAADFELVRHCGAVLFHDYDQTKTRKVVFDFVNSLPAGEVKIFGMFALWRSN